MRDDRTEPDTIELSELWSRLGDASSPRAVAAAAAFLLTFYVGLALAYRDAIPLFEAPDEPSHLHYAAFVHSQHRLPRLQALEVPGEGRQPPLVYVVAAPLLGATDLDFSQVLEDLRAVGLYAYDAGGSRGGARLAVFVRGKRFFASDGSLAELLVLRSISLMFGALAVIFTFAATWRLSRDARLSLLAASLLAFNPQLLFASGYFSNDTAAAAVGAAALWLVVRAQWDSPAGPSRAHYLSGALLFALGFLTKLSTLPGLVAAVATIAVLDRRDARARLRDLAIAAGAAIALLAPYALWAAQHRGGWFGIDAAVTSAAGLGRPEHFRGALDYLTRIYWDSTFESYWGRFGWSNVSAPKFVYLAFFTLSWTGVLGYFAGRSRDGARPLRSRALRGYLVVSIAATLAAHLLTHFAIAAPQGRQLFAIAPQLSLLLALGIHRLLGSERRMLPLTIAIAAGLVALDVYCLRAVLVPAYWEVP